VTRASVRLRMVAAVMGMSPNWQWGIINTIWARGGGRRAPHPESGGKASLTAPKYEKYTNLCELYIHETVHRNKFIFNNQPDALIIQIFSVIKLYMFRASSVSIIRSLPLYIRQWLVSCRFDDRFQAESG